MLSWEKGGTPEEKVAKLHCCPHIPSILRRQVVWWWKEPGECHFYLRRGCFMDKIGLLSDGSSPMQKSSFSFCVPLSVYPRLHASLYRDPWIPTHLPRSLLSTCPQAAQPTFQISGLLVSPLAQLTDLQSRAESWYQRLMSTIKSRVKAGSPGFVATRAWLLLRFGSEIRVYRIQFPIMLGGKNGLGIQENNILELFYDSSCGRLQKALHTIIKVLGICSCYWQMLTH